jgi:diadenosine tetraphosphate (Ap4A) HIT family hydrolase
MPELSRFYGIVIRMYFGDHDPPHFHAYYSGDKATFAIDSHDVLEGHLPVRAKKLVEEWVELHKVELEAAWKQAVNLKQPGRIDPLP